MTQTDKRLPVILGLAALAFAVPDLALAHDVSQQDAAYVERISGPAVIPFLYLGAKHMVTGLDHVLFLVGVVFYLFRLRDVLIYVSLFTLGHSLTLMGGVLAGVGANSWLVDAVIGFSIVYKAFENMGGLRTIGLAINPRLAVFAFGLAHGMGLATKLMDLTVSPNGLLTNLISFNVGVELGQALALLFVVLFLDAWRRSRSFAPSAFYANVALMAAGLMLTGYQLTGYFLS